MASFPVQPERRECCNPRGREQPSRKNWFNRRKDAETNAGIILTESFAMHPGASVSGLYFSHPEAKYFGVGQIGHDQVVDYAARRDESLPVVEKRLAPNLDYNL